MTMIIEDCKTKKELKARIASGENIAVTDPSLMPEWRPYGAFFRIQDMRIGGKILCTNHPKRSWFACITRTAAGFKVD